MSADLSSHAPLLRRLRGEAFLAGVHYAIQAEAWMAEAADEIEALEASRDEMLAWLVEELAYPFNFFTDNPIPVTWRHLLVDAWADRDGDGTPEDAAAIRAFVTEQGRWA